MEAARIAPDAGCHNAIPGNELRVSAASVAASALHPVVADSHEVSSTDPDRAAVISAWATLTAEARRKILAIVAAFSPARDVTH